MHKPLVITAAVYAVSAVIHVAFRHSFPYHLQLPVQWIFILYLVLTGLSAISIWLAIRAAMRKKESVGNVFLIQSLVKFFAVVLFLVVMIKLTGVSGKAAIVHVIPPYFVGLTVQTILIVKQLKKN